MVAFLAVLPSFLATLPKILELLTQSMMLLQRFATYAQDRNLDVWFSEVENAIDQLEKAKSSEDKKLVARNLVNLVGRL
jgi:hypothetical protein